MWCVGVWGAVCGCVECGVWVCWCGCVDVGVGVGGDVFLCVFIVYFFTFFSVFKF